MGSRGDGLCAASGGRGSAAAPRRLRRLPAPEAPDAQEGRLGGRLLSNGASASPPQLSGRELAALAGRRLPPADAGRRALVGREPLASCVGAAGGKGHGTGSPIARAGSAQRAAPAMPAGRGYRIAGGSRFPGRAASAAARGSGWSQRTNKQQSVITNKQRISSLLWLPTLLLKTGPSPELSCLSL